MFNSSWFSGTFSHSPARRAQRRNPAITSPHRRHAFRPSPEALETRIALSLTTLASFGGTTGANPYAGVIMDSSGNLYGTTLAGGASGDGTVFELVHGSGTINTLASFNGTNGSSPRAGVIIDSSGNLYGTAFRGGASNYGTVFEVAQGSGTITTLASFNGTNGSFPRAGVIIDSSGNLYGTTSAGGGGGGTVFELAHGSGTITTLALCNPIVGDAWAGVIMDSSGNLYGTGWFGGTAYAGTVFELAHGSHTITPLASFLGVPNGRNPYAGLIMYVNALYGTASGGGASSHGTVFELLPGSHTITALASFNGTNGSDPVAALIRDRTGNLYGTTDAGGASNDGTVFELARGSGTITTLTSFNGTNGQYPKSSLIMDGSGNLYGTTEAGGASNDGTVFELTGAAAPTSVRIGGLPSSTSAGTAHTFTGSAQNPIGAADAVDFTRNDKTSNPLTNDTASDMGTLSLTGFVLQKKGKPSITDTDTLFSSITGSLSLDVP